jgi:hypothetical protein
MNRLVCLGWITKPERKESFSFETRVAPLRTQPKLQPRFLTLSQMRLSHNGNLELMLTHSETLSGAKRVLNPDCSRLSQCCVTGMPLQSLSSKWHAAKARRGSMFLCDLRPRSNAGAGPFSTQPSGPRFLGRIFASLPRPASQRMQALRSLLQIRPNSSWRL